MSEPVYLITDDAAMLSLDPKRMHPTDLAILKGKTPISTADLVRKLDEEGPVDAPYPEEEMREMPPDTVRMSPGGFRGLVDDAGKQSRDCLFIAHGLMSQYRSEMIRELRVDKGQSWRAIASEVYQECEHLPGFERAMQKTWWPPSNQLMGMALCEVAAQAFGEDYMAAPWN